MKAKALQERQRGMRARFVLMALICAAFAHSSVRPFKVVVRHADPYMIKAILDGRQVNAPEISTVFWAGGSALLGATQTVALFQNGYWFVNPTDNSLWFVPKQ